MGLGSGWCSYGHVRGGWYVRPRTNIVGLDVTVTPSCQPEHKTCRMAQSQSKESASRWWRPDPAQKQAAPTRTNESVESCFTVYCGRRDSNPGPCRPAAVSSTEVRPLHACIGLNLDGRGQPSDWVPEKKMASIDNYGGVRTVLSLILRNQPAPGSASDPGKRLDGLSSPIRLEASLLTCNMQYEYVQAPRTYTCYATR